MPKKTKSGKARKDRFYFLAKETGYRSRAAFKLIQLNRRYNFLGTSKVLVDLCAAPGGWLQVAAKEMPVSSQIIGVDLVPIQSIPRVKTFIADITTEKCKQLIRSELGQNKADVVLHDGAPNVGTAWTIDEFSQANLCLQAFALATTVLRKGGWFVSKVFRSRDYEPIKWVLSQFFRTVRAVKPEASRMESAEIFVIGQFYRAPDRIDQRFLDPKHVFGEVETPKDKKAIIASFMKDSRKKKKAEGYADGDTLYHELRVSDFLYADGDPLEVLARTNKIVFDLPRVRDHDLTTDNVKTDLDDIQVLGKAEIKNILKWRKKILAAMASEDKKSSADNPIAPSDVNEEVAVSVHSEVDEELAVEEEVERLRHEEMKEQKKRLKRVRKARIKLAERLVLKMDHPGDRIEEADDELFSLSTLHDLAGLERANQLIGDTSVTGADALAREESREALRKQRELKAEQERLAIEGNKGAHFERRATNGASYLDQDELSGNQPTTGRDDLYLTSDEDDDTEDPFESDFGGPTKAVKSKKKKRKTIDLDKVDKVASKRPRLPTMDDDDDVVKRVLKKNPLLVDLDDTREEVKEKRKIKSWLESTEMKGLMEPLDEDLSSSDGLGPSDEETKKPAKKKKRNKNRKDGQDPIIVPTKQPFQDKPPGQQPRTNDTKQNVGTELQTPPETDMKTVQKFKRLRRPLTEDEKAIALRLVQSAKSRRDLINSAYHRFQFFEDPSELPDWFAEDETKHMRKRLPITKSEVPMDRPTMGRSISKVEEAKARKKARLAKRLKRIRQKVEDISDDVTETEKWQQIKQMYKKAGLLGKKRRPFHMIVNTKGGARSSKGKPPKGAKVKIVDRRMKADARVQPRGSGKGNKKAASSKRPAARPVKLLAHKPRQRSGRRR